MGRSTLKFKSDQKVGHGSRINTDLPALIRPEGFDDPRLSEGQRSFFGQLGSLLLGWMQTPGNSHSPGVEEGGRPKHTCPSRFYPLRDYS